MFINGGNYRVLIETYAERHYIKSFSKKYKKAWDITLIAIKESLSRIDSLAQTDKIEIISTHEDKKLIKHYFKIAGTNESTKSSGNRAIVFVDDGKREVNILLVYSKNDICPPNETQKWQSIIKENYREIWDIFS